MPEKTLSDPPLVDVKVTNPVTYFKLWWKKVIGNEGMELRLRFKPLTTLLIAAIVTSIAFGVGGVVISNQPSSTTKPTSTPEEIWKETAYTGTLQFSEGTKRYYLLTSSSPEAITLEIPEVLNIEEVVGKRILVIGDYSKSTKILKVTDIKNLEVLPKTPIPIPTNPPTPTIEPTATPTPEISPSPTP